MFIATVLIGASVVFLVVLCALRLLVNRRLAMHRPLIRMTESRLAALYERPDMDDEQFAQCCSGDNAVAIRVRGIFAQYWRLPRKKLRGDDAFGLLFDCDESTLIEALEGEFGILLYDDLLASCDGTISGVSDMVSRQLALASTHREALE